MRLGAISCLHDPAEMLQEALKHYAFLNISVCILCFVHFFREVLQEKQDSEIWVKGTCGKGQAPP